MPARTLPNLGLKAGYDPGENGWADDMTLNLLKLSVLSQGYVLSKVAAEPGSPTVGDVHILDETHATHPNEVIVYDGPTGEEEWVYIVPNDGWLLYNQGAVTYERFDGTEWSPLALDGITEAPVDGEYYGRKDGAWEIISAGGPAEVVTDATTARNVLAADMGKYIRFTSGSAKTLTAQPDATEPLQDNGEWHIRNAAAGDLTIVEGSGVTVNPPNGGTLVVPEGGTVTLKRVAEDEFDLLGQTVAA